VTPTSLDPMPALPDEVQSLLESLRNREGPSAEAKAVVRARLDQTLSLGWEPSAPAARVAGAPAIRVTSSAGRWMLAAAGLAGLGGMLWVAGRTAPRAPESQPRQVVPLLTPANPGLGTPGAAPGAVPTQSEPVMPAVGAPTAAEGTQAVPSGKAVQLERTRPARRANATLNNPPAPIAGAGAAGTASLSGERRLLDQARNALRDGDASRALAAVGEHARLYPDGQLTEEREVLGIQAMVRSGSYAEARARGQAFLSNYPDSPLHTVVQSTVDSIP
jgi:hypothetical protein